MSKTASNVYLNFLEESLQKIKNENLNCYQIIKYSKEQDKNKNIKGLTNLKIKAFFWEKGFKFDDLTKEWIELTEDEKNSTSPFTLNKSSDENNSSDKYSSEIGSSSQGNIQETDNSPHNNSKEAERLSQKIIDMESSIKEILQKISQIEVKLNDKSAINLSNISSSSSLKIPQILELSYTKGKRYEITLRDTLVNKATEKLKGKYNLESIDLSKTSTLIEIILFDYINFEK